MDYAIQLIRWPSDMTAKRKSVCESKNVTTTAYGCVSLQVLMSQAHISRNTMGGWEVFEGIDSIPFEFTLFYLDYYQLAFTIIHWENSLHRSRFVDVECDKRHDNNNERSERE